MRVVWKFCLAVLLAPVLSGCLMVDVPYVALEPQRRPASPESVAAQTQLVDACLEVYGNAVQAYEAGSVTLQEVQLGLLDCRLARIKLWRMAAGDPEFAEKSATAAWVKAQIFHRNFELTEVGSRAGGYSYEDLMAKRMRWLDAEVEYLSLLPEVANPAEFAELRGGFSACDPAEAADARLKALLSAEIGRKIP